MKMMVVVRAYLIYVVYVTMILPMTVYRIVLVFGEGVPRNQPVINVYLALLIVMGIVV